jgi:hypothetical protein
MRGAGLAASHYDFPDQSNRTLLVSAPSAVRYRGHGGVGARRPADIDDVALIEYDTHAGVVDTPVHDL